MPKPEQENVAFQPRHGSVVPSGSLDILERGQYTDEIWWIVIEKGNNDLLSANLA